MRDFTLPVIMGAVALVIVLLLANGSGNPPPSESQASLDKCRETGGMASQHVQDDRFVNCIYPPEK